MDLICTRVIMTLDLYSAQASFAFEQKPASKCISSGEGYLWANHVQIPRKVTTGHPELIWFVQEPLWLLICTVPSPHLLGCALFWPSHFSARRFGHFRILSFQFDKICWIRFFSFESLIRFHIWGCPIFKILACLFTVENIGVGKGAKVAEMRSLATYLVYYFV